MPPGSGRGFLAVGTVPWFEPSSDPARKNVLGRSIKAPSLTPLLIAWVTPFIHCCFASKLEGPPLVLK